MNLTTPQRAIGSFPEQQQTKLSLNQLANGNYPIVIKGSQAELHQAQSVLSEQGVRA